MEFGSHHHNFHQQQHKTRQMLRGSRVALDGAAAAGSRRLGRVAVIGGGPSGLSAAYHLNKYAAELGVEQLALFEASDRLGGWVKSTHIGNEQQRFFFEVAPRSLSTATKSSESTLRLIEELRLVEEVVPKENASPLVFSQGKFTYVDMVLIRQLPSLFCELCLAPIRARTKTSDESVYNFYKTRVSEPVADLIATMVVGIFGGDAKRLSMKGVFPEVPYDSSVTLHMLARKFKRKNIKHKYERQSFFSLRGGLQTLMDRIASNLKEHPKCPIDMKLSTKVHSLDKTNDGKIVVRYSGNKDAEETFDFVVSTTPSSQLINFIQHSCPSAAELLSERNETASMATVNLAWNEDWRKWDFTRIMPSKRAFGYLLPPKEKDPILGVVFDSDTFPLLNNKPDIPETRMTVMLGGSKYVHENIVDIKELLEQHRNDTEKVKSELLSIALAGLKRHFNHEFPAPTAHAVNLSIDAIPQYLVNHPLFVQELQTQIRSCFGPSLQIIGNSFLGVGVNDSIAAGDNLVQTLLKNK